MLTKPEIEITDEDIKWLENTLSPYQIKFDEERIAVLKNLESTDIQACPGSGKTTLLVGKLAILAKKWNSRTQGICVISHTNAARIEIENKLGKSTIGQKLLQYPHFVGTIQTFIQEYLSKPRLLSKGYPIRLVDEDYVIEKRKKALKKLLEKRKIEQTDSRYKQLHKIFDYCSHYPNLNSEEKWGKTKLNDPNNKRITSSICKIIKNSFKDGYFTYDEMFLSANVLIDKYPIVTKYLQYRFPYVFIDEAQDCNETQIKILDRIFPVDAENHIRERFGDVNQAIYDSIYDEKPDAEDLFPQGEYLRINNSHRFTQKIADLAFPLGLIPDKMEGSGEGKDTNTIIIFDDASINNVLPTFGEIVLDTFDSEEKQLEDLILFAVGHVHKPKDKIPKSAPATGVLVMDYFKEYTFLLNIKEPSFEKLCEYVFYALDRFAETKEYNESVNIISKAILNFLGEYNTDIKYRHRRNFFQYLKSLFEDEEIFREDCKDKYISWLRNILKESELNENIWNNLQNEIVEILNKFTDSDSTGFNSGLEKILAWDKGLKEKIGKKTSQNNVFKFPENTPLLNIQVGNIHSVKGQTHDATLVLDTFFRTYHFKKILPWLKGSKIGKDEDENINDRLKLHYVAMTRPRHLLCLAINKAQVDKDEEEYKINIEKLKNHGWAIKEIY